MGGRSTLYGGESNRAKTTLGIPTANSFQPSGTYDPASYKLPSSIGSMYTTVQRSDKSQNLASRRSKSAVGKNTTSYSMQPDMDLLEKKLEGISIQRIQAEMNEKLDKSSRSTKESLTSDMRRVPSPFHISKSALESFDGSIHPQLYPLPPSGMQSQAPSRAHSRAPSRSRSRIATNINSVINSPDPASPRDQNKFQGPQRLFTEPVHRSGSFHIDNKPRHALTSMNLSPGVAHSIAPTHFGASKVPLPESEAGWTSFNPQQSARIPSRMSNRLASEVHSPSELLQETAPAVQSNEYFPPDTRDKNTVINDVEFQDYDDPILDRNGSTMYSTDQQTPSAIVRSTLLKTNESLNTERARADAREKEVIELRAKQVEMAAKYFSEGVEMSIERDKTAKAEDSARRRAEAEREARREVERAQDMIDMVAQERDIANEEAHRLRKKMMKLELAMIKANGNGVPKSEGNSPKDGSRIGQQSRYPQNADHEALSTISERTERPALASKASVINRPPSASEVRRNLQSHLHDVVYNDSPRYPDILNHTNSTQPEVVRPVSAAAGVALAQETERLIRHNEEQAVREEMIYERQHALEEREETLRQKEYALRAQLAAENELASRLQWENEQARIQAEKLRQSAVQFNNAPARSYVNFYDDEQQSQQRRSSQPKPPPLRLPGESAFYESFNSAAGRSRSADGQNRNTDAIDYVPVPASAQNPMGLFRKATRTLSRGANLLNSNSKAKTPLEDAPVQNIPDNYNMFDHRPSSESVIAPGQELKYHPPIPNAASDNFGNGLGYYPPAWPAPASNMASYSDLPKGQKNPMDQQDVRGTSRGPPVSFRNKHTQQVQPANAPSRVASQASPLELEPISSSNHLRAAPSIIAPSRVSQRHFAAAAVPLPESVAGTHFPGEDEPPDSAGWAVGQLKNPNEAPPSRPQSTYYKNTGSVRSFGPSASASNAPPPHPKDLS